MGHLIYPTLKALVSSTHFQSKLKPSQLTKSKCVF